jgi:hypothetical protein
VADVHRLPGGAGADLVDAREQSFDDRRDGLGEVATGRGLELNVDGPEGEYAGASRRLRADRKGRFDLFGVEGGEFE